MGEHFSKFINLDFCKSLSFVTVISQLFNSFNVGSFAQTRLKTNYVNMKATKFQIYIESSVVIWNSIVLFVM